MPSTVRSSTPGVIIHTLARRFACTSLASLTLLILGTGSALAAPSTLFGPGDSPSIVSANDTTSVELGMRFRADGDGFVKGVRFYKGLGNDGTHVGSLWTNAGVRIAAATFTGESTTGWQEVSFDAPIAISADTTYVVSYFAPAGHYSASATYFAAAKDAAPLHGLATGVDGANGVYGYGAVSSFPTSSFNANNYWVDVVFDTTAADTTAPVAQATSPVAGATGAPKRGTVTASFTEALDPATVGATTAELRTAGGQLVPAAVSYDAATKSVVIDPTQTLAPTASYTATIAGGSTGPRVTDVAGNALAAPLTWSFTTAGAELEDGPGGPILVIGDSNRPFSLYYAEILRAEGLNEFSTADLADVTPALLAEHQVAILGDLPLTAAQVTLLTDWVTAGGNLVAMHPDKQLASLGGIADAAGTLDNAYLKVDTSAAPGTGIVSDTIQFHGSADRYTLAGATAVATLYGTATTATTNPAVTLRSVGTQGGQVATFAYDLARSVVQTRQGNPAWIGQERDGVAPVRSDDLFFGAKVGDVQPDWIDLDKVAIPQADEQQRLLANIVTDMNVDKMPLPRFWYLPGTRKAAIVHALDDHATQTATKATFDAFVAQSPAGCSVADWTCFRATSWFYSTIPLTDGEAAVYHASGFDLGSHVNTGCANYASRTDLDAAFDGDLATFTAKYPSLPPQTGNRTHCIVMSDWDSTAKVELDHGIRIDMGYYYWPGSWVQDRPGFFTGSGMPMRYAETSGRMIDVYQTTNQLVNENQQSYPAATNALLDRALGSQGYYAVLGTHDDYSGGSGFSDGILASARARGVAVVSAHQMLTWLDGRNTSSYRDLAWSDDRLTFTVQAGASASNLSGMLPVASADGPLQALTRNGAAVTFTTEVIKGVSYAFFPATAGSYVADYRQATIFGAAVPTNAADSDSAAVEVGTKFRSDVAGSITGVRFYKGAGNTGTHVGSLWTSTGTLLRRVTFAAETATGWQEARFSTPVAIDANVTYVVSYHAPNGHYAGDNGFFASGTDAAPLHALASGVDGQNGVYAYGATSSFPGSSFQSSNYWVDVRFSRATTTPAPDPVPGTDACPCTVFTPTTSPANVEAADTDAVELGMRFSSDDAGVVSGVRFYKGAGNTGTHVGSLWSSSGALLATVTFTGETVSGWQQAHFATPVAITAGATYVVSYHAPAGHYSYDPGFFAASGVNAAPLHAPASAVNAANGVFAYGSNSTFPSAGFNGTNYWVDALFEHAQATPPPAPGAAGSLFASTSSPVNDTANDGASVEVGMKFRSDVAAQVAGVRFYKGAANTGVHVGSLWSGSGALLGSVTFTGETATGWQEARFGAPIAIQAGTTYVVSYHAPNGRYAGDNGGFTSGIENGNLHGLANGVDGGNGVYAYASTVSFPTSSWQASNYWVDVVVE